MNMHSIQAPATAITFHPLETLFLSPLNPRQDVSDEEIAALAASIQTCGMIQNLAGLETSEGVAIVAGGRRLRALQLLAKEDLAPDFIPVRLAQNEAEARAIAMAENTARADLDPADEITAYGRMEAAGASLTAIASAFAVTEAHVRRRLKLANLPRQVLAALKARKISLDQAAVFTLCEDADLVDEALEFAITSNWTAHSLTNHFTKHAASSTDRRAVFVGLEAYQAAGGVITEDLFSSKVYLQDTALLARLFADKLAAIAADLQASGWKWAEFTMESYVDYNTTAGMSQIRAIRGVLSEAEAEEYDALAEQAEIDDDLTDAQQARFDELEALCAPAFSDAQMAQAGGFICVNHAGDLRFDAGYIRPEDRKEATEAGILTGHQAYRETDETSAAKVEEKSPYSAALIADMKAARLASIQGALLAKPELALDLLAYTLDLITGHPSAALDIRSGSPSIIPSVTDGFALDPRLDPENIRRYDTPTADGFIAYQEAGKKARNAALTAAIARSLNYGCSNTGRASTLFDHIEDETKASIRQVWTPNAANFFGRVSGPYLESLLSDLLGVEANDDRLKSFAKMKKKEKAITMENLFADDTTQKLYALTPEQIARLKTWVPDCF